LIFDVREDVSSLIEAAARLPHTHLSGDTPQRPKTRSGAGDALGPARRSGALLRARRFTKRAPHALWTGGHGPTRKPGKPTGPDFPPTRAMARCSASFRVQSFAMAISLVACATT